MDIYPVATGQPGCGRPAQESNFISPLQTGSFRVIRCGAKSLFHFLAPYGREVDQFEITVEAECDDLLGADNLKVPSHLGELSAEIDILVQQVDLSRFLSILPVVISDGLDIMRSMLLEACKSLR